MTTVVLLHAFPVDSRLWASQAVALRAEGLTVVTPELPGFGGSETPEVEPDLRHLAEHVLAQFEGAAVVVGLSMGGYVLMEILRIAPDRVAAAGFVDTKAGADAPAARENRIAVADRMAGAEGTEELAQAMIPALLGRTTQSTRPDVVAAVRHMIHSCPPGSVAWAQRAMAARPDSHAALESFAGPALVVWGEEDELSPWADQEAMIAVLRDCAVVTVPGAGHMTAIEDPAPVTMAIRHLVARVATGPGA